MTASVARDGIPIYDMGSGGLRVAGGVGGAAGGGGAKAEGGGRGGRGAPDVPIFNIDAGEADMPFIPLPYPQSHLLPSPTHNFTSPFTPLSSFANVHADGTPRSFSR